MELKDEGLTGKILAWVERLGNRLPHPTTLFIMLSVGILGLSALLAWADYSATHPLTHKTITTNNLISVDGLHLILEKTVTNFTQFAPVGTVLIAMLGLGIAEKSGLLGCLLRIIVLNTPTRLLTPTVVFAGTLSSLAADAGYVILIPLAGYLFACANRHPVAGMAAAFAGVSGGFSANLMVGPVDAMLAGISTEAAGLVSTDHEVSILSNYYFMIVSTFLITLVASLVTDKLILPKMPDYSSSIAIDQQPLSYCERKGVRNAGLTAVVIGLLLLWATIPDSGILRNPETGELLKSPFIKGIVPILSLVSALCGIVFGITIKRYRSDKDIIVSMEDTMAMMAGYLVLMFFAAQFVSYFSWSNIGLITAIKGSALLNSLQLPSTLILFFFIIMAAGLNLLIGSASAKWAIMAPIFIPMFMLAGIAPEVTQASYRVGDSITNIITPLMPYFGVVVAFMQRYEKDIGVGSILALMLPYSVALLVCWSALFAVWLIFGLPFGPTAAH